MSQRPQIRMVQIGRPTVLTNEFQDKFCELLRRGNFVETACGICGISTNTVYRWLKQGEQESEGIHSDFYFAYNRAIADCEAETIQTIRGHAQHDWKAGAWLLERRYAERWSKKEHIHVNADIAATKLQEQAFESQITSDPETVELLKRLWHRQQVMSIESSDKY